MPDWFYRTVSQPLSQHLELLLDEATRSTAIFLIDGELRSDGNRHLGRIAFDAALNTLKTLRMQMGHQGAILVAGGIHQPADARIMREAGADFVQIDTGLIFSGPGLCKRINASILHPLPEGMAANNEAATAAESPQRYSWFWTGLLGVAMALGSLIALWIAATDVVLPYDLEFCGLSREQLVALNPNLLPFMSHDRVTLAGSMIALGVMYTGLSLWGSRKGHSWAKTAILLSAGAGFFSFFLFLGFDYFDPFHGFVTAVLFQLFTLGLYARISNTRAAPSVDWEESFSWKMGLWGQLLMVMHSVGLLLAGTIICFIGINDVLIGTDLAFLNTDYETLQAADSKIIPLVAHDRATLGGMLVSAGIVYLLIVLWGIERSARWLWHTLWWSALAAYTLTIGVHFKIGYTDWLHLLPAFIGLAMLTLGMGLLFSWMHARPTKGVP